MTAQQLAGTTAIVTGASRGLGRGIAAALTHAVRTPPASPLSRNSDQKTE